MAHLSFTVTPAGGSAISFAAQVHAAGRYAIRLTQSAPVHEIQEFHASGVDGNYVVNHGRTGQSIALEVHYINTYATAVANYEADCAAIVGKLCSVADALSSKTYDRLLLMDDAPIQGEPRAVAGGLFIIRARYLFSRK